jgi:hypothetical protein
MAGRRSPGPPAEAITTLFDFYSIMALKLMPEILIVGRRWNQPPRDVMKLLCGCYSILAPTSIPKIVIPLGIVPKGGYEVVVGMLLDHGAEIAASPDSQEPAQRRNPNRDP